MILIRLNALTEGAARLVKAMVSEGQADEGKFLRVFVEKGGCSGMQYGLVFDQERERAISERISTA